jgi:hypothetical protein
MYADRWRVRNEDLVDEVFDHDWLCGDDMQGQARRLEQIGDLLDVLIPERDMQWHFWYRPSLVNTNSPLFRLGWGRGCLAELIEELEALTQEAARLACGTSQRDVLRLFQPVTMYRRMDRRTGFVITHLEVDRNVRPARWQPLQFRPSDFAAALAGPPLGALVSDRRPLELPD